MKKYTYSHLMHVCGIKSVSSISFWRLFPNFLEGGCKSLTRTRNFVDSTTYLNDARKNIFDSTSLSKRDQNFLYQQKKISYYYKMIT